MPMNEVFHFLENGGVFFLWWAFCFWPLQMRLKDFGVVDSLFVFVCVCVFGVVKKFKKVTTNMHFYRG